MLSQPKFYGLASLDGEHFCTNICGACVSRAQNDGYRIAPYKVVEVPCEWCTDAGMPHFTPPYLAPVLTVVAPSDDVVCDMADYFSPLDHKYCGAC